MVNHSHEQGLTEIIFQGAKPHYIPPSLSTYFSGTIAFLLRPILCQISASKL